MGDLVFNRQKVVEWYKRKDIFFLIASHNDFKYVTFMAYDEFGKSVPPRRFQSMAKTAYGYEWTLRYNGIGNKPASMYRDVDNWLPSRPFFSIKKEVYKEQRSLFFANGEYRKHIHSTDFVFDIDGKSVYQSWHMAKAVVTLLKKFDIMYSVYCSGKKGFQIFIPHHKSIAKKHLQIEGKEYNTHEILAYNIKRYLNDTDDLIDMSVYSDLRFVKQPYSLDGRNMCPIIPLYEHEFNDFINYENKDYNPYTDIDYWMKIESFIERGFVLKARGHLEKVDEFIDNWITTQEVKT